MQNNGQVLRIIKMGHDLLRAKAEPIADPKAPWVESLIRDMRATLIAAGGVGLAAPQVARSHRVIILRIPSDDGVEESVVINPEIEPLGLEIVLGWEGCLSMPGMQGLVPRYTGIHYQGFASSGEPIGGEAHDFTARVFQHEIDHLDGKFYINRMIDLSSLTFSRKRRYATEPMPPAESAKPPESAESAAPVQSIGLQERG